MSRIGLLSIFLVFSLSFADDGNSFGVDVNSQNSEDKKLSDSIKNMNQGMRLKTLIEGAKTNYTIEAKEYTVRQNSKSAQAAWGELFPTVDLGYSYTDTNNISSNFQYTNQQMYAGASLSVFSGFSGINKIRQRNATYRSSVADKNYTQESLFLNVIESYYGYFTTQSRIKTLKQQKIAIITNVDRQQKLYNAGLSTIDDLESLKAESSNIDYQLAQAELDLENIKLNLELMTNQKISELVRDDIKMPTLTKNEREDIRSAREQVNSLDFQARQITYLPSVTVSDQYTTNKPNFGTFASSTAFNPATTLGFSMPKQQNVISLTATMRIFDGLNMWNQSESIQYTKLQMASNLAYKKAEQDKDIEFYKKSLEIAKLKLKAAEDGLKSATISFNSISKKYDANLVSFVEYLQSLTSRFTAEATYSESLNSLEIQKAYYIFYSGQKMEDYL